MKLIDIINLISGINDNIILTDSHGNTIGEYNNMLDIPIAYAYLKVNAIVGEGDNIIRVFVE